MSSAAFGGLKRAITSLSESNSRCIQRQVTRSLHSTGIKGMSEHGSGSYEDYMHAKHMYNLDKMKHRMLKMTLFVWGGVAFGIFVPVYTVHFQRKKSVSS
eukprot:TRINITY_DN1387_c0_g2_i1.p1 TRINITY_DN1387_c0_g2~~TRINITY_DN1387_c0_g2_i1.p1  ORF type:complete len:100 (+),score=9.90 TRINITY_DN1387_c0_g2_i1:103-402(+)